MKPTAALKKKIIIDHKGEKIEVSYFDLAVLEAVTLNKRNDDNSYARDILPRVQVRIKDANSKQISGRLREMHNNGLINKEENPSNSWIYWLANEKTEFILKTAVESYGYTLKVEQMSKRAHSPA